MSGLTIEILEKVIARSHVEFRKLELMLKADHTLNETGHHEDLMRQYLDMMDKCADEIILRGEG